MRILIVDDDQVEREFTVWTCERLGHTTIQAATVKEAREIIEQSKIDCAIVDTQLHRSRKDPHEWGWTLVPDLKKAGIHFFGISSSPYSAEWVLHGAHGFMWKPIDTKELVQKLRQLETA